MLAVEVVKIWMGRFLEHNGEVDAFVLTYNHGGYKYKLLNTELRSKYFQDQEEKQVQICHCQEFMKTIAQDPKMKFTQDQHSLLGSSSDKIFGTPKKFANSEAFLSIESQGLFKKIPLCYYPLVIFSNYFFY